MTTYGSEMTRDPGLHPILSFAGGIMLVGGTLYLLQASLGSKEVPPNALEPAASPHSETSAHSLSFPAAHEAETQQAEAAVPQLPVSKPRELAVGSPEHRYGTPGADAELQTRAPEQLFDTAEPPHLDAIRPQSRLAAAPPIEPDRMDSAQSRAETPVSAPDQVRHVQSAEESASGPDTELKGGRPTRLAAAEIPRIDTIQPTSHLDPAPPKQAQRVPSAEISEEKLSEVQAQPAETGAIGPAHLLSSIPTTSAESAESLKPIGPASPLAAAPPNAVDVVSGAELPAESPEHTINEPAMQPALVEPLAPDRLVPSTELPQPNHASETGSGEKEPLKKRMAAAPPPPLRRPPPPRSPAAAPDRPPRRQLAGSGAINGMRPMTLASPDTVPETRAARTQRQSLSGYKMTVWTALARHKPKAGQRGSTTVSFGINPRGGLGYVRISRSSGNPRLDQLALATVRAAAPFPSPPESLRHRPYTVRIDFH
jgi:protein TonB